MALEITDANFDELVLKSDKPVMVDFWAEWCGPCRMLGPIIEEVSKDYEGKAIVGKLDVDSNQEFAEVRRLEISESACCHGGGFRGQFVDMF